MAHPEGSAKSGLADLRDSSARRPLGQPQTISLSILDNYQ
jgi:hypothetical protein